MLAAFAQVIHSQNGRSGSFAGIGKTAIMDWQRLIMRMIW